MIGHTNRDYYYTYLDIVANKSLNKNNSKDSLRIFEQENKKHVDFMFSTFYYASVDLNRYNFSHIYIYIYILALAGKTANPN